MQRLSALDRELPFDCHSAIYHYQCDINPERTSSPFYRAIENSPAYRDIKTPLSIPLVMATLAVSSFAGGGDRRVKSPFR